MEIWDNYISREHESRGEKLKALLVRIMTLVGKISLLFLLLGFFQLGNVVLGFVLQVDFSWLIGIAIMCFFASATVFSIFGFACAIYAVLNKDYPWAIGIIIVNILSVPYLWLKTKEIGR